MVATSAGSAPNAKAAQANQLTNTCGIYSVFVEAGEDPSRRSNPQHESPVT